MDYVVGYMLRPSREEVLLLCKQHPEYQKGKWNGVGGKIEAGESSIAAMVREFHEEAGVLTTQRDWEHFATLHSTRPDAGSGGTGYTIYLFRSIVEEFPYFKQMTDEPLEIFNLADIYRGTSRGLIPETQPIPTLPNMRFLLPLAFSFQIQFPVVFQGVTTH